MAIDKSKLAENMLVAAKGVFAKKWPEVEEYAGMEFKKIAESIDAIERMKLSGRITEEQARLHLDIQKNATRTVFLALEGLGILIVEQAIKAALSVIKDTVNSALGWKLIA